MSDFLFAVFVLFVVLLFSNLILFILGIPSKKALQLNKIKEMLESDISIYEDELVRLYALKNVDNNKDKIEDLEFKIRYHKDLIGYIISKM